MRLAGPSRRWIGRAVAAAGLAVLAAVYFWPVIGPAPTHSITSDLLTQSYPWRRYVTRELLAHRLPQWTPYAGFGFPLLADIETTVLYPVSVLGSLLAGGELSYQAVEREDVFHYAVGGLGMFLFLGRTGAAWTGAVVGAVTFMFSGFMWAHVGQLTIVQSASWAPWLLLGVAHLLARPGPRAAVGAGLALALAILGGHPQTAWLGAVAAGIVLALGAVSRAAPGERAPLGRAVPSAIGALVLGIGLSAVQIGPTLFLARLSDRWDPSQSYMLDDALPPAHLATLLVPLAFRHTPRWASVDELHGYLGILPLGLAAWAVVRARDRWMRIFAALAGLGLLAALGLPPFVTLVSGGYFRIPARGLLLVAIGVAGLAARGADALCRAGGPGGDRGDRRLLGALWMALACATGAALVLRLAGVPAGLRGVVSPQFRHHWDSFTALGGLAAVTLTAAWRLRAVPGLARAVVLAALLVEVFSFPRHLAWSHEPPGRRWPDDSDLAALARTAGEYRIMLPAHTTAKNAWAVYRLRTGTMYSSLILSSLHEFDLVLADAAGDTVFPLTGTRWLVGHPDLFRRPPPAPGAADPAAGPVRFRQVARDRWEVLQPLPRAYQPARVVVEPGRAALRTALQRLRPTEAVLLERPTRCPGRTGPAPGADAVVFEVDEPERVVLRVRAAEAGPLVLSDTYYPGWGAAIDGRHARIRPADLMFRMVCVPAGEHRVEFTFRQPGFLAGLWITAATGIAALALVLMPVAPDPGNGRP
jgi:hypothetical protein